MGWIAIALMLLTLVFAPGVWVRHVLKKYSLPADRYPGTGAELARLLLDRQGLDGVTVETSEAGDHYDPTEKAVRLTPDNFHGRSLTAVTVAAHEVGHAVQDHNNYVPLKLRTRLVRLLAPVERLGAGVLILAPFVGMLTRAPAIGAVMLLAGLVVMLSSTLVHALTLPTEFDASFARALPMLDRHRILKDTDRPHARRLLTAAALTYVSASLLSLLNIARWWSILRR
ncbi:MAG: zinc metallopeptidase [Pseudomonadota bacterium]